MAHGAQTLFVIVYLDGEFPIICSVDLINKRALLAVFEHQRLLIIGRRRAEGTGLPQYL